MPTLEREILDAEEVVGAYLFIHPEARHIPYSLRALGYRARNAHFAELLQVSSAALSGGEVNFRAHLSTDAYRFWHERSVTLSLSPTAYEQVADALRFLCDTAKYDRLRTALREIEQRLTPRNISIAMHDLLEQASAVLHAGTWQIQYGDLLKEQYTERLRGIYEAKNFPLYTHLSILDQDDIFLPRREYTLISGRTGAGKTSLACILAFNLLFSHEWNDEYAAPRPLNIFYISLEVPTEAILAKILSIFTHRYILPRERTGEFPQFTDDEFRTMKKLTWNDFYAKTSEDKYELTVKVLNAFTEQVGDRLAVYHSPVLSGDDIVLLVTSRALELLAQGKTLDVVIIDFIQNLRTRSEMKGQSKEGISLSREIGHTIQELQQVFNRFETCGIVLSQVNDMGEVRDSRVLEHLASTHIRIGAYYRDLTPLFSAYFTQGEHFIQGKPLTKETARKEAQRLNNIALSLHNVRLLDVSVVKNRYGHEIRVPKLLLWKPSVPTILRSYDIAGAIEFLAEKESRGQAAEAHVSIPTDHLPSTDFPF